MTKYANIGFANLCSALNSFIFIALISRLNADQSFGNYFVFLTLYNMFSIAGIYTISNSIVKKNSVVLFILSFVVLNVILYTSTYLYMDAAAFLQSIAFFVFSALSWAAVEGYARAAEKFKLIAIARFSGVLVNVTLALAFLLNDTLTYKIFLMIRAAEFLCAACFLYLAIKGQMPQLKEITVKTTNFKAFIYFCIFFLSTVPGNVDKLILNLNHPDITLVENYNKYSYSVYVFSGRIFEVFSTVFFVSLAMKSQDASIKVQPVSNKLLKAICIGLLLFSLMFSTGAISLWLFNVGIQLTVLALICIQAALFFLNQYYILQCYANDQLNSVYDVLVLTVSAILFTLFMFFAPLHDMTMFVMPGIIYNIIVLIWLCLFPLKRKRTL